MFIYEKGFVIINHFKIWENEQNNLFARLALIPAKTLRDWFYNEGISAYLNAQIQFYKELETAHPFAQANGSLIIMLKSCGFEAMGEEFVKKFKTVYPEQYIKHVFKQFTHECLTKPEYLAFNKIETTIVNTLNQKRKACGNLSEKETLDFVQHLFENIPSQNSCKNTVSCTGMFKHKPVNLLANSERTLTLT